MNQEELLKLFHKYGFYSLKKEPFLYDDHSKLGIVYTIKDPFYGNLSRVYFPDSLNDAEDFLAKYSWWKKYGAKYHVTIKCDDYKIENPHLSFLYEDEPKTIEELRNLSNHQEKSSQNKNQKAENYLMKLQRTIDLLLQIMKEKQKNIENTFQNYQRLDEEYHQKEKELQEKINHYEKKKDQKEPIEELKLTDLPISFSFEKWQKSSQKNTKEEMESWINECVEALKELELNDEFLEQKYKLIRYPLFMKVQKEKLECLEKNQKKKKGLFGKKEKIEDLLAQIDEKSSIKNIVPFSHFKENEKKRIEEKYAVIPDLDIRTVADYLIEFDNLKINTKEKKELPKEEPTTKITYEETMEQLEESFEKRPKEEQVLLISYQYLTKHIWTKVHLEEKVTELLESLSNPNNIMVQVKYFKQLNLKNPEYCIASIEKIKKQVSQLETISLPETINVFFKDQKKITENLLKASNKRLLSPIQQEGENEITYIASLQKGTEVLFIPYELEPDIENDEMLVIQPSRPYFFFDLQKNTIIGENSDILKVVEYNPEKEIKNDLCIVSNLKRKKIHLFKYITIERKKENV